DRPRFVAFRRSRFRKEVTIRLRKSRMRGRTERSADGSVLGCTSTRWDGRLLPLQRAAPHLLRLLRGGAWREIPILLRSLESVLGDSGLPRPLIDALGIWT